MRKAFLPSGGDVGAMKKHRIMVLGILLLLLLVSFGRGAIISQSSIKDCTWGDSSEPKSPSGTVCEKKMLISMVLGSGKVHNNHKKLIDDALIPLR